jgi:hypothetical protein
VRYVSTRIRGGFRRRLRGSNRVFCDWGDPNERHLPNGSRLSKGAAHECGRVQCRQRHTHKVELHDFWHKPFIQLTHAGVTRKYLKSEILGFRSCEGRDYRFVGNCEYRILEAKRIVLYSVDMPLGRTSVRLYCFSDGADGQVLPLTRENLKCTFPDNHRFHDALDITFDKDDELTQYDEFHRMFKVNHLLEMADAR